MAIGSYGSSFLVHRIFNNWINDPNCRSNAIGRPYSLMGIHRYSRDLFKDGQLLYRHSARCPTALQWFLDCNPIFWPFVPMSREEADKDNAHYQVPTSVPTDPSSPLITAPRTRSDLQAGSVMSRLPPLPDHRYTFSTRQCVEQFQLLKDERNRFEPNPHLDLYNATLVAVCQ